MKAYNETLLHNEFAQEVANKLQKEGKISTFQLDEIKKTNTPLPYNPNIFIKILLFLFGCLGFGFGGSLMTMFFVGLDSFWSIAIVSAIYGVAAFFILFSIIPERKFHFSGIDNALIYCGLGSFLPLIFQIYESAHLQEMWIAVLLFLPFLLVVTYVFGEPLVALVTFLCVLFIVASLSIKTPIGKSLLPFILMISGAIVYWQIHRFFKKNTSFYWKTAIEWVGTAALILFYVAGNYYVVREANAVLNALPAPAPEIAFSGVFWGLTFLVPTLYLYWGIRWRDRILLLLSLAGFVASVLTLRFYYAVLPMEWGFILGGLVAFTMAVAAIRYLKTPKHGFSKLADIGEGKSLGIETVVLSHITQNIQSADHGIKLGGGDFGGGGAGEKY